MLRNILRLNPNKLSTRATVVVRRQRARNAIAKTINPGALIPDRATAIQMLQPKRWDYSLPQPSDYNGDRSVPFSKAPLRR
ncbi:hypothetical protein Trydic_g2290 [Trypoxylus dichotomus]